MIKKVSAALSKAFGSPEEISGCFDSIIDFIDDVCYEIAEPFTWFFQR